MNSERDEVVEAQLVSPEAEARTPAVADDVLPETLCLMPVPHRPFFPGQVQPVAQGERDTPDTEGHPGTPMRPGPGHHHGSRAELARALGISERTLYRKLQRLEDAA